MAFEFIVDTVTHRATLNGRSARLLRGTPHDFLTDPGVVLQQLQAGDFETLRALLKSSLTVKDDEVEKIMDAMPGDQWAAICGKFFDDVLSFFQPEKRKPMVRFLRALHDRRVTMLDKICQQIGGELPSNSSAKPESTSTSGPSETCTASPLEGGEPNGIAPPA